VKIRTALVGVATAGILVTTAATAHAAHDLGETTVALNGANEVGTAGDRNGSGKITIDFFSDAGGPGLAPVAFPGEYYLCYDLVLRNLDGEVVGAHIHEVDRTGNERANPRKLNGPVVVDLLDGTGEVVFKDAAGNVTPDEGDAATTCVTAADGVIEDILDAPREYYVNVHTDAHPAGAVRGQLSNVR
jgi:hypothetical protein